MALDYVAPKLTIRHQEKFQGRVERKYLIALWGHHKILKVAAASESPLTPRCLGMYDKNASCPGQASGA